MTKTINVDSMVSGREMDAKIATEVMGLNVKWEALPGSTRKAPVAYDNFKPKNDASDSQEIIHMMNLKQGVCQNYSTKISGAWQVVERMRSKGLDFVYDEDGDGKVAGFYRYGHHDDSSYCEGDMASLAICRAALRAVRNDRRR